MDATARRQPEIVSGQPPRQLRERLSALIKEARERARRRRRRIAAAVIVLSAAAAILMFGAFFNSGGGGGTNGATPPSRPFLTPRATAAPRPVANGPLTLIANHHVPQDNEQIAAVGAFGATGPVFDCPAAKGCYELTTFAWSPNGRWLAFGATFTTWRHSLTFASRAATSSSSRGHRTAPSSRTSLASRRRPAWSTFATSPLRHRRSFSTPEPRAATRLPLGRPTSAGSPSRPAVLSRAQVAIGSSRRLRSTELTAGFSLAAARLPGRRAGA